MLKTLIIITPGFPKDEDDSTCIPAQQIFVKALTKASPKLNIVIITLQYPLTPSTYKWHGIEVNAIGGKDKGGLSRRFIWIKAWLLLKRFNKKEPDTGILSFWFGECAYIANSFAKKNNLPHYSWILGQDAKPGNKYFKLIKPKANVLIALSDFIVREFASNYHITPAYVVPVGSDASAFGPGGQKRHIDVIAAGSLIPLKQYHVFINVIATLKKQFPYIKALICGDGPEKEKLKATIYRLNLSDTITLSGELPHKEVLMLMQRSKVFLHTSNYEGFGAVNLEALYAGAKVISFVQPMQTPIPDWHIAVNQANMAQIAADILSDKDLQYQSRAVYNIEDNANRILSLFDHNAAAIS